jgi:2-polyprenyl-3-methyl-5-hydroxy-6-metoxy-1,4-benzoquinol methylase
MYALLRSLLLICAREVSFASMPLSAIASPPKVSAVSWRKEYADGEWDRLHQLAELGHYSVIAGYFGRLKPGGSVLDVACGEGVLQRHLKPHGCSRYLGIDYVPEAISAAVENKDPTADFALADAAGFVAEEKFDVIIFNECLYYFDDPIGLVQRYAGFLEPGGMFIISNYSSLANLNMIRAMRQTLRIDDEVSIINRDGISWTVQLGRPKRSESAQQRAA